MATREPTSRAAFRRSAMLAAALLGMIVLAGCGASAASVAPTVGGKWTAAGAMKNGREFAAATKLQDGTVLVTGGIAGNRRIAAAELFDPATKTWTEAGSLSTARTGDVPVLLHSGKVMVIGGYDGKSSLASTEIFDPAARRWTAGPEMSAPRTSFAAVVLKDGRVLVAGGYDGVNDLSTVELYDPDTNQWKAAAPMMGPRSGEAANLLPDGKVLISGGQVPASSATRETPTEGAQPGAQSATEIFTKTCEIYDPSNNQWAATGSLSQPYINLNSLTLRDGRVMMDGYYAAQDYQGGLLQKPKVEIYSPASGTWTPTDQMLTIRLNFSLNLLQDGRVLAAGGLAQSSPYPLATAEVYDPASGHWSQTTSMANPRQAQAAVTLDDGNVLVAGGVGADLRPTNTAETFSPALKPPPS